MDHLAEQIEAVAVLKEPLRRKLYALASTETGVSRDQAARALGISRELAAFHLDKLVEEELLVVESRRLSGRSGPGAGRPANVYRRSERQLKVSLPQREYELAARLFLEALSSRRSPASERALSDAARQMGETMGAEARRRAGPRPSRKRLLEAAKSILDEHGFEPRPEGSAVRMANCPFDTLATRHRDLVCNMNLALLEGVANALRDRTTEAVLDPKPGVCCVKLAPARN